MRAVHEVVAKRKPTQYSTVLKFMQIMTEKGLLRRDAKDRAHVFEAARPREWTQRQLAGDLLRRAFNGSASGLMMGALSAQKLSKVELEQLRKLLDDYRKEAK